MKKTLFILLLSVMALAGCEQFNLDDYLSKGDAHKVSFRLSAYTMSNFGDNPTRATSNLREVATRINFAVYQNGSRVQTVDMDESNGNFGTISLSLAEGTYQVMALAHNGLGNATTTDLEKIKFKDNKMTDTFLFFQEMEVTKDNTYEANLERVVSMVRIVVEDEIPSEVKQLKFYYTGGSSTLSAKTGFGSVNSRQTEYREVKSHDKGQVFEIYTLPHETDDKLNLTITALNSGGEVVHERLLSDVPITIRRITTFKGELFSSTGGYTGGSASQFPLTVTSEWEGEDEYGL